MKKLYLLVLLTAFSPLELLAAYPVTSIFNQLKDQTFRTSTDKFVVESLGEEKGLRLRQAWASFLPQLDLSIENRQIKDYTLINTGALGNDPRVFSLLEPQDANLKIWSVNLYLPIYRKDLHTNFKLQGIERDLAQHELSEFDQAQLIKLEDKFAELLVTQLKLIASRNAIVKTEKELKQVRLSLRLGKANRTDVLRMESLLLKQKFQKAQSEQERLRHLHDLEAVSGIEQKELIRITRVNRPYGRQSLIKAINIFSDSRITLRGVKRFSPERFNPAMSPAFKKLELELKLERTRLNALTDREYPEVYLQGSLYNQGPDFMETIEGSKSRFIAIGVKVPIFNGGRTLYAGREQIIAGKRKERQREERMKNLVHEFSERSLELQSRQLLVQSLEASLKEAESQLKVSERGYLFGKSTQVEVLESMETLLNREVDLARERTQLYIESRRFLWETGLL